MQRADCQNCKNRINRPYPDDRSYRGICDFMMRGASTAGGSEPDDLQDVYWCSDFDEDDEQEEM